VQLVPSSPIDPAVSPKPSSTKAHVFPSDHRLAFGLVTLLFFIWGMSNNLTDILVQQFKKSFELSAFQAQLVQTAVFLGYFCMALPAALLMQRRGYRFGIVSGLCLFGVGTLMFWPAAVSARYSLMLAALFLVGCGSATLETAANPFIAQFGSPETSERRLNFSQTFNPLGTIVGVLIGTFFIFSGIELSPKQLMIMKEAGTYVNYLHSEIMRVVPTYVTLGCVVLLLAIIIGRTSFPHLSGDWDELPVGGLFGHVLVLLRTTTLRFAIFAQFCYCGAQVSTWSAFIPYVKQYTHATERTAALFLTGHLVALFMGRSISTALMRWLSATRMLSLYVLTNIVLVSVAVLRPGFAGASALVMSSFFMSMMYPTIFALGVKGLGPLTKLGGSLIVMSVVGGAVVPPLLGLIARQSGSYALAYSVVIVCYVGVALYALRSGPVQNRPVGDVRVKLAGNGAVHLNDQAATPRRPAQTSVEDGAHRACR
jgi:MFS transporter, FHS family, L-fucose permease